MKIFAAHNPDAEIRKESSAGGVFSILASQILRAGGIVYGVGFNLEWKVVHLRIDNEDELWRIRGSKYVYSHIGTSITDACRDLDNGHKVLFSGTPCQVAAMRKRAGDNPNLLLVEVICHGAPEPKYWQRYLDEICTKHHRSRSDIQSINFRDKRTGWKDYSFTICFSEGKLFTQRHDDNLYMRAFLSDLTLREVCFRCPFKYPDGSHADITLGDFWGITQLAPEIDNNYGTTIVIARTSKGTEATALITTDNSEYKLEEIAKYNPALTTSANPSENKASFFKKYNEGKSILKTLNYFTKRPISESFYIKLARIKHKILR